MSLNSRKDEDILNDLHSAEGRHDFSEIIDLETEIKKNKVKEEIHKTNMEDETEKVNKEESMKMEEYKKVLQGDEKDLYLRSKFREIEKTYKSGIQPIDITTGNSDITKQIETAHAEKYIDINDENVKKNLDTIQKISKQIAERTKEHIYAVIGTDGSIHLVNDIDTGHYIISKNILEKGDILSFIEDIGGKKSRGSDRIENLDNIDDVLLYQKKTGKDKILQVRDNIPLKKSEDKTDEEIKEYETYVTTKNEETDQTKEKTKEKSITDILNNYNVKPENEKLDDLLLKEEKVDMSKKPKELTATELQEEKQKATLNQGFSWNLNKRKYEMGATNNIPFVVVKLEEEAYNKLSSEQQKKFKKELLDNGKALYVSSRGKEESPDKEKNIKKIENETGIPDGYTATKKGKRNFAMKRLDEIIKKQGPEKFEELLKSIGTIDENSIKKAVKYQKDGNIKDLNILLSDYGSDIYKKLFEKYPAIQMNTAQLSEQLKGKRILFYTGAGLSIGGGIPLMSGLQEKMGIKYGDVVSDQFLERFLDSPKKAYAPRNEFTEQSINGKPTEGHYAIKSLANKFGCQILTENIDLLQRNTGIMEYHTTGDFLRTNISEENDLKKIDYIIVVGLSNDDRGLFQRYKDVNPNGKIVAFNRSQPNYLGEKDILIKGDVQDTLPELDKLIQSNTSDLQVSDNIPYKKAA